MTVCGVASVVSGSAHADDVADQVSGDHAGLAPGATVIVRDEEWLVTNVARSTDGWMITARGQSEYVKDKPATFFTRLDDIRVFDPAAVTVKADDSPGYRRTRLWLETVMRQTPVPLHQDRLAVAKRMLADPLDYQLSAVRKALSADNIRPRVLIADAVGLGKTLEMGMILAELIRRGRGDRILVVTPRHVLEQFQQEMWTRFAIPLVRLDSIGIQRVRQKLPASRNPFTYFPRVIVSMDTIKSPKYRAQLEKVRWDAVVIDEIHNATNVGTQNNELARVLAPTTEALILASATPHNGDPDSFKEILRLLDPTSVLPDGSIDELALNRLIIRRHRHSDEVAAVVGEKWAEREEPKNVIVDVYPEEQAVADELQRTWLHPEAGHEATSDRLFPWTLVKAFFSSPAALGESIEGRIKRLGDTDAKQTAALERLRDLNEKVAAEGSGKYHTLVNYLNEIGVGRQSPTRAVVFSERVATLEWLRENLAKDMKLPKGAVEVMHGGLSDQEQMRLIDEFKREDTPLRILVTGDVASEGVNLHSKCHHLIHYDIPWSLIRIQQRNGRIDRYGQTQKPQIATLVLDPDGDNFASEVHVLTRLMEREHEAHQALGDVSSLMGQHSVAREEDAIRDVLRGVREFEDVVKDPDEVIAGGADDIDMWLAVAAGAPSPSDATPSVASGATADAHQSGPGAQTLYQSEIDYLEAALNEAFHDVAHAQASAGGVSFRRHGHGVAELVPTDDLKSRFDLLPQDYLAYRRVNEKVTLATSLDVGDRSLRDAREGDSESTWPKAHFLGPLHPVTQWAAERALPSLARREIPAVRGNVDAPTVLLLGTLTNKRGQVISRAMVTVTAFQPPIEDMDPIVSAEAIADGVAWLESVGLGRDAVNTGAVAVDAEATNRLVTTAVSAAHGAMAPMLSAAADIARDRIESWGERVDRWEELRSGNEGQRAMFRSDEDIKEERALAAAIEPDVERRLVRPILVVFPPDTPNAPSAPSSADSPSTNAVKEF